MSQQIDRVRLFNRAITARLGVLTDSYLSRSRPLGQARVLWELGSGDTEIRSLRARLALDSGYLSRLLRALEAEGLVTVGSDDGDGRVRTARLTTAGRAEYAELEARSESSAAALLAPLSTGQRERLTAAMDDVRRLLLASQVELAEADPASPPARFAAREYYAELAARFEEGFDPMIGGTVADPSISPPQGLLLLAAVAGETVGCGALTFHSPTVAELKRVWAAPSVRGLGLGRRLVEALEDRARAAGATTVQLDTNRALTDAIAMYRRLGYIEVSPYNDNPYADHWFAKDL
jgi:DNA-binding MarR family transcriptional regulator